MIHPVKPCRNTGLAVPCILDFLFVYLPPANEESGKVMFSVCLLTGGGGMLQVPGIVRYISGWYSVRYSAGQGGSFQCQVWGVPLSARSGGRVPSSARSRRGGQGDLPVSVLGGQGLGWYLIW